MLIPHMIEVVTSLQITVDGALTAEYVLSGILKYRYKKNPFSCSEA